MCGTGEAGVLGLVAARQLAGHGVRTQVLQHRQCSLPHWSMKVFLPDAARYPHSLETELRLYRLTGGKVGLHWCCSANVI